MAYNESMRGSHALLSTLFDPCLSGSSSPRSISTAVQLRPNTKVRILVLYFLFLVHFSLWVWFFMSVGRSPPFLLAKIDIIASDEPAAQVSEVRSGLLLLAWVFRLPFFC